MAFYSVLLELIQWLVLDFDKQVMRYLVGLNFGADVQYEITAQPLEDGSSVQSDPNDPNAPNNPLDPNNQLAGQEIPPDQAADQNQPPPNA
jgi:hypothetical protein